MWAITLSLLLCLVLIPLLEKIAPAIGLTDKPSDRKQHSGHIPLIGGIAIFASLLFSQILSGPSEAPVLLCTLAFIILTIGTYDDVYTLSARFRLVVQTALALAMAVWGDIKIDSLGSIMGGEPLILTDTTSTIFTVLCIVGVINAINMIDGLDGLSGSILLISISGMALLNFRAGALTDATFQLSIAGTLIAFLVYNNQLFRSHARVFMGDGGSMMLGLILAWYFIKGSQGPNSAFSTVSAGWLFGLPLMETVSVMTGRIIEKRSPLDAGRDHMHHRLIRAGFSVNATVGIMLTLHIALVCIGLSSNNFDTTDSTLFWGFVTITLIHIFISRFYLESGGTKIANTFRALQ